MTANLKRWICIASSWLISSAASAATPMVSAGNQFALGLKANGTISAWGRNDYGQLGNGQAAMRVTPAKVDGIDRVTAVVAGDGTTLAIRDDGAVWAWGSNGNGQLGDGTAQDKSHPVRVTGVVGTVKSVATYAEHALAATSDGSVWAWGWGLYGQLGNGDTVNRFTAIKVAGLPLVGSVSAGSRHSLALATDGSVYAWGDNSMGQLGDGSTNARLTPARISALSNIVVISTAASTNLALDGDGRVWAWGCNGVGELADGIAAISNRPVEVQGLSSAAAIAAGRFHALALGGDGGVWTWGNNRHGGLGNGTRRNSALPQRIPTIPAMSAVAGGNGYSLALEPNGTVWSWGYGDEGQLGNSQSGVQLTPKALTTIVGVTQLAVRYRHALALRQDGSVWAWGTNEAGQLGDGTTANRSAPTPVSGLANEIIAVAAGTFHSMALDRGGNVWTWGYNAVGQLGDGTETDSHTPVRVAGLNDVVAVAAGENASYAITRDGRLWSWGYNIEGELGIGSTSTNSDYARPIEGLAGFVGIAGGVGSAVALRSDGSVWAWGRNFEGELGDATFAESNTPVLTVNAAVNGPLDLDPLLTKVIPSNTIPPFFAMAGRVGDLNRISVSTMTKFNAADLGKPGEVFVTAMVPPGSLVPAQSGMTALGTATVRSNAANGARSSALTGANTFVLIQLPNSGAAGWQPVVNGQLVPYSSGVLGDQLAAQIILNNADTTNIKGAQFCLGYGTSAEQMIAAGAMRVVATIPDPSATTASAVSCIIAALATTTAMTTTTKTPATTTSTATTTTTTQGAVTLNLTAGWNLVGNSSSGALDVLTAFGNTQVSTVWKWIASGAKWAFYAPSLAGQALTDYASGKGYEVLTTVSGGEGFWVNAKMPFAAPLAAGTAIPSSAFQTLAPGWSLIAIGDNLTPSQFSAIAPLTTLWAWDATQTNWYFYAPGLEAKGGTALTDYISGKGYLGFTASGKTLGPGIGFWVNKQ